MKPYTLISSILHLLNGEISKRRLKPITVQKSEHETVSQPFYKKLKFYWLFKKVNSKVVQKTAANKCGVPFLTLSNFVLF